MKYILIKKKRSKIEKILEDKFTQKEITNQSKKLNNEVKNKIPDILINNKLIFITKNIKR